MKQLASTFFLLIFLFNSIGYYSLFVVLNTENKAEIKTIVQDEKYLETIRIHRSEIKNIIFKEEGKEFLYKGEMYDVKSKTMDGHFIVFRCINDKTEKQLNACLHDLVKHNSGSNSSSEKKQGDSSKNPVKDLFFHQNSIAEVSSGVAVFPPFLCHLTSYIPPILPLPPPEIAVS